MQKVITKHGFTVGERVLNLDVYSANFKRVGTIIGFHSHPNFDSAMYIQYALGDIADVNENKGSYMKISDIKELIK